jgi:SsrA-binding protein
MTAQTEQKGLTIVPLSMYLKKGMVKVELGICKGKNVGDKRETLKRKTADLEAARAMRQR